MEGFILFTTVVLVIAYMVFAICTIVKSDSFGKDIGTTLAFAVGGCVAIPVASFLATVLCWGIVVVIVLAVIGFIGSIFG
ncbi:MAG: hypothetical protein ACI4F4_04635 [Lachnospiraceae bacterium]